MPKLLTLPDTLREARERQEMKQDKREENLDKHRRPGPSYETGDKVLLETHTLSNANKGISSKLAPRYDGPYTIAKKYWTMLLHDSQKRRKCNIRNLLFVCNTSVLRRGDRRKTVEIRFYKKLIKNGYYPISRLPVISRIFSNNRIMFSGHLYLQKYILNFFFQILMHFFFCVCSF